MTRPTCQSILLLGILVVLLAATAMFLMPVRQPAISFEGRTLNEWLADFDSPYEESRLAAEHAVAQIGPPAIPVLRAQLARRDSFLAPTFRKIEPHLPRWTWRRLFLLLKPYELDARRKQAAQALGVIGPPAAAAVPDLLHALTDHTPTIPPAASQALYRVGKEALPALTNALHTAPTSARVLILAVLRKHGKDAEMALPVLLDLLARTCNQDEISDISGVLGQLGTHALLTLFEMLASTDAQVRSGAMQALQVIADRNPAVPVEVAWLYPAQPLRIRTALVDFLQERMLQRHLTAFAMLTVALDPDADLQQRAVTWLRQNIAASDLERLLAVQPESARRRLRDALLLPGQVPHQ